MVPMKAGSLNDWVQTRHFHLDPFREKGAQPTTEIQAQSQRIDLLDTMKFSLSPYCYNILQEVTEDSFNDESCI